MRHPPSVPETSTLPFCAACADAPADGCERCARLRFLQQPSAGRRQAVATAIEQQRVAAAHAIAERASALGGPAAGDVALGVVPHFRASAVPLPAARRQAFLDRVGRLAREARGRRKRSTQRAPEDGFRTASPAVGATLASACAHCGGHCCRGGGDHAHLDVSAVRHWLAQHPNASDADAVAAYERHLPTHSLERSCVYHAPEGCSLPRAMRSDTCNRYLCADLANLATELEWRASPVAFVSTVRHGELGDGVLTDGATVQLVRLTRANAGGH